THDHPPPGQQWPWLRPEIRPDQPAKLLHPICGDLERQAGGLERHIDDVARRVVGPAVVGTAQAIVLWDAVRQADRPVRAAIADQSVFAPLGAEQGEVFSQQAHRLDRLTLQLDRTPDWMPVA